MNRLLVCLCCTAFVLRANPLFELIGGADADLARLVFLHPAEPDRAVIYDLGLPAGGPDAALDPAVDLGAFPLRQPFRSYDALPEAVAIGLELPAGAVTIEVTVVLGASPYGATAVPAIHWNDRRLAPVPLPAPADPAALRLETLVCTVDPPGPGPGVLWLAATGADLVLVDAVQVRADSVPTVLEPAETRRRFAEHGLYEARSLAGQGQVLVADFYHGYPGNLEYEVFRPLRVDARYLGYQEAWFPLSQWREARLVCLNTRHRLTIGEAREIHDWVAAGGVLIVTPGTLQWFLLENAGAAEAMASFAGGYTGHWQKLVEGQLTYRLAADGPSLPAQAEAGTEPFVQTGDLEAFMAPDPPPAGEIAFEVTHSQARFKRVAMFVHPIGKGLVVGSVAPFHPRLVKLWRRLVIDALAQPVPQSEPGKLP